MSVTRNLFERLFLLLFLCFPAVMVPAHDGHRAVDRVPDKRLYGATAVPDRIVLSFVSDPATSMAVTWRTDSSVRHGIAQIAPADHGPNQEKRAKTWEAKTEPLDAQLGLAHYHSVVFAQLKPQTMYVYRVGDGINWSEWSQFTTAAISAKPFHFIYVGDAQNDIKSRWSRLIRQAYSDAPKSAFVLHAGDLVNVPNHDGEWGQWFYAGSHIHRSIPAIATPGNHEYTHGTLSDHWRPTFTFPADGPAGLDESVYKIDYQGARIISLNSNEKVKEQISWLEQTLRENENPWTIVTFHHPVYSTAAGRDNKHIRDHWQPLFDKYRVDLVLQGHDHTYGRSGQMKYENIAKGAMARSADSGTVYVVSVSGPKMYDAQDQDFMLRVAEDTQLYQIIRIDGNELRYEARTAIGELYDAFVLRKQSGRPNQLVNQIPDTPEYRRK